MRNILGSDLSKKLGDLLDFSTKTPTGITNILTWLALSMYFLFVHFFLVPITVVDQTDSRFIYLFVLFVPPAVKVLLIGGDSISHARNRWARFFQSQFPDRYLVDKYNLRPADATHLWFLLFDRRKGESEEQKTMQYGYTCRLIYYTYRAALFFLLLSGSFLAIELIRNAYRSWDFHASVPSWQFLASIVHVLPPQDTRLIYFGHVLFLTVYLRTANRVQYQESWQSRIWMALRRRAGDPTGPRREMIPSGVWSRWKHINDRNKAWLDSIGDLDALRAYAHKTGELKHSKDEMGQ